MTIYYYIWWVIVLVFLLSIRIIKPNTVGVVLFLGKTWRVLREWVNMIVPFFEIIRRKSLALVNLSVKVDGITIDNVKTIVSINVIYRVKKDDQSIIDSIFKNSNVVQTITSLIEEQLRARIFEFSHEEIFGKRSEIGDEIRETLRIKMAEFGMELDSVQVVDIQVKRLLWEGMALQREAIAKWFKNSIGEIKGTDSSLSGKDILDFLLNSSRIETLEKVGQTNAKIIYINENLEGKKSSMINQI